jgi:hypothetical protein
MNKRPINKMLDIMRERADTTWPAMYGTHQYKYIMTVLAKSNDEITYAEKEFVRHNLQALCLALGLNYYQLLKKVCQD